MNAAPCPCCVDLCWYVHSSLLHWHLPTLFVSSICFFYVILEMSSIKIRFSPAWHSIIGLHEVIFLPLPWSQYRVSVLVMLYQLSFARDTSLARCSGVSHDVLVVTSRAYYVSPLVRRAFLHRYVLFSLFLPCPQGVSPSIWSIIRSSSWCIITSLSAVVFFELLYLFGSL